MVNKNSTKNNESKSQTIKPEEGIPSATKFGHTTIWKTFTYANDWLSDIVNELKNEKDYNSIRREIVFAVCFAESYFFEWVRDRILGRNFEQLNNYFRPGKWIPIEEKIKNVSKQLYNNGFLKEPPDFGKKYWEDFTQLVKYRNGLVHARASRPETDGLIEDERPLPTKDILDKIDSGWALRVVVEVIDHLHEAAGMKTFSELIKE